MLQHMVLCQEQTHQNRGSHEVITRTRIYSRFAVLPPPFRISLRNPNRNMRGEMVMQQFGQVSPTADSTMLIALAWVHTVPSRGVGDAHQVPGSPELEIWLLATQSEHRCCGTTVGTNTQKIPNPLTVSFYCNFGTDGPNCNQASSIKHQAFNLPAGQ